MSAFDDLQSVMFQWKDRDSVIKPKLRRLSNVIYKWRVQIVDEDSFLANGGDFYGMPGHNSTSLDTCVNWSELQLKTWPECKRMAWDMWDFKHRKDAEKFITLFHLSWEM